MFSDSRPFEGHDSQAGPRLTSSSDAPVPGVPFIPIFEPPMGHNYGQQQFPSPMILTNYGQYGPQHDYLKTAFPAPPPPSHYYSRYQQGGYPVIPYGHPGVYPPPSVQPVQRSRLVMPSYNFGSAYTAVFDNDDNRNRFTKGVMTLLLIQWILMSLVSGICLEVETIRSTIAERTWIPFVALGVLLCVILYTLFQMQFARKGITAVYVYVLWTFGFVVALTWITAASNSRFVFITQCYEVLQIATLLWISGMKQSAFLTGKNLLFCGTWMVVLGVCLTAFYTHSAMIVFSAILASLVLLTYFLFRLHYVMGDEGKNLQLDETLIGTIRLFF